MGIRLDTARHPRRPSPARRVGGCQQWRRLVPLTAAAWLDGGLRSRRKVPREVAALFIDVEGCTRLCEDLSPREMNTLLETYFSEFLDVVRVAGGEVTEVMGDGLLALFEVPDARLAALAALGAALGVRRRTARLNGRRPRHDPVTVNMGLNAGEAFVGFTRLRGRSGERWVYAATGPVTNVAARLAALAHGGQILATRETAALLSTACVCRSLGPHVLKNVTRPVEVVEITNGRAAGRSGATSEIIHG
ncbi:MAG TPA: adenylate/guanylate cyclase domain-containing protein [Methylomirabilota bacterium]|nr:adenylate/guanylate cyclase domain-containing protein [Methylomirabilota bacterium]